MAIATKTMLLGALASLFGLGALSRQALADPSKHSRESAYRRHALAVVAESDEPVKVRWIWTQRSFGDHVTQAQDTKGQVRVYRPQDVDHKDKAPKQAEKPRTEPRDQLSQHDRDLKPPTTSNLLELRRHP